MVRAGRPKLLLKDGHHHHDGYSRWHSVDQAHHPDLHDYLNKSEETNSPVMTPGPVLDIYNLIVDLEKMEYGNSLLFELQNSIQTILQARKLKQAKKRPPQEFRNEQSALGGTDGEDREPNTYGLP